ncbi:MAG: PD40 domain-containing protein [Sediminibacterium sp. Gen4]|jgi:tricorn protease|uniref:S41 family peptidase n=1 Tax=unclassified Sediminibacterium TaxID=2635961 RepID=UPI0015BD12F8|nr:MULTISPECIES: S41 family peptidase [unclassified Sediminibacterium]MBW0160743.1 PDZ domain-containing protein [Sediminibacterium sp.]MBW0165235.1 PDZ domain-containing protein [Sediminibacterium sp.]NWK65025.1 PD40 domain-containing protein [Sediminibacterium sp. Gen4]
MKNKYSGISRIVFCLVLLSTYSTLFAQGTMLLRQPNASKDHIVFVHADDIWVTTINGGDARRLTSAMGTELNPKISPDGKWVAFTGQYDGNTDVYIVSIDGGEPKRMTWHPGADIVHGWLPDGTGVYFTSGREGYPTVNTKFFTVSIKGGTPTAMPLPFGFSGTLSPDGQTMAYLPYSLWDPEWRNYRGGQAQPIWLFNMKTFETVKTKQGDQERHSSPTWNNGILYFLSEQDYINNIWSYDPKTKAQKQITFHKDFDIKNVSAANNKLIYEQGGYLHSYDVTTQKTQKLEIHVKADLNWGRPRWNNLTGNNLINASLSPTGKRALFESRGEIFTVPKENGDWRNITNSTGAADRSPVWSPDGQKLAWFSDASGEYQLMVRDQFGLQEAQAFPIPNKKFYFTPAWSPDSKYIAFTDTDYNIWYMDVKTGAIKKVDTDRYAHPNRTMKPVWSPDSKWIAYVQLQNNQFKAVKVYNLETGVSRQLTDGLSDAIDPQWDESGKYLYFLASTDFGLATGWLDMSNYNYPVTRALYIAVLNKDAASPLEPKSDDEPVKNPADTGSKQTKPAAASGVQVKIDFDGLDQRIIAANIPLRNYTGLVAGPDGTVFYMEAIPNQPGVVLNRYSTKDQKTIEFARAVNSAVTSADRKNLLYRSGAGWYIVGTAAAPRQGEGRLATDAMKVYVDPGKEAEQIYKEGWRLQRDFLYVDNVHGAPWDKIYEWYKPWVKHVKHRSDLNYIIDIISGEVAVGHSYVSGGDFPDVPTVPGGLLGADYQVDNGYFKIKKIYTGENWNPELRSPLSGPGISVKVGDYLLEVNGQKLDASMNLYRLFEGTANRQIKIRVNSKPTLEGSQLITVVPIANEAALRSRDWVEGNRRKVDALSGGKLAYVYVPNTGDPGYTSFNRYYFSQQDKQGAIIDERNNGGGSAADYMIDVMSRKLQGYFNNRVEGHRVSTTPMAGIWGPKVMIINENAGSGGDLLPYMFRKMKLGPLVGTRTWGGLVGTWDTPPFIDGGRMVAPRGGFFDTDGKWAVEAEGVAPDIEVFHDPKAIIEGRDPQLERAVQEALRLMPTQGIELKKEPAPPIRSFRPKN